MKNSLRKLVKSYITALLKEEMETIRLDKNKVDSLANLSKTSPEPTALTTNLKLASPVLKIIDRTKKVFYEKLGINDLDSNSMKQINGHLTQFINDWYDRDPVELFSKTNIEIANRFVKEYKAKLTELI